MCISGDIFSLSRNSQFFFIRPRCENFHISQCNSTFGAVNSSFLYRDAIWASWCLNLPITRISVHQLFHAKKRKKPIKAPHYWGLVDLFPTQKAGNVGSVLMFDLIIWQRAGTREPSQYKDVVLPVYKTVWRLSHLYNGNPCTRKDGFIDCWILLILKPL